MQRSSNKWWQMLQEVVPYAVIKLHVENATILPTKGR